MTNENDQKDETSTEQPDEELSEDSQVEETEAGDETSDAEAGDQDSDAEIFDADADSDDETESDEHDDSEAEAAEAADDSDDETESDEDDDSEAEAADESGEKEIVEAGDGGLTPPTAGGDGELPDDMKGMAAFFDLPDELMLAAAHTRDSDYDDFEAYSPFPIHGMDEAMGLGRSWIPWVTFGAGMSGLATAIALQFGTMTFDWPMNIGGKPFAPAPAFVPIMFELSVLFAGVITAIVMLIAAGCFRKPFIIDPEITSDRFALWISADDDAFDADEVREFMESLDPVEIRTITEEGA